MNANQMEKFNPDVFGIIQNKLARNHNGLKTLLNQKNIANSQVFAFNTSKEIENINENEVDIVITSPPYGDSRTTVAYGQFSRLANEWLDYKDANQVDNSLMGGKVCKDINNFENDLLNEKLNKIKLIDIKRAKEVVSFYLDYEKSINNVSKLIKENGYVCYVVGNRRVKGEVLPTDEITKDFFEKQGFKHIETIIRNIPNKRMPSKNSPSNIAGITDSTMNNEYIVVLQKNK
jgi:DNA modification methylase